MSRKPARATGLLGVLLALVAPPAGVSAGGVNTLNSSYTYDDRGNLARASYVSADGAPEEVADYAYDGLHRPRRLARGGTARLNGSVT